MGPLSRRLDSFVFDRFYLTKPFSALRSPY